MNEQKIYNSKELNELIGYVDKTGNNSYARALINRCAKAGIKIEQLPTKRGCPNQYIILENNFIIPNEQWIDCYYNKEWEVSDQGRIRKKDTKRLMGYSAEEGDYLRVCTIDPQTNKSTNKQVNRLIYFSFHPELLLNEKNIQIDHLNGIRTDNRLENLQPLSAIDNTHLRDNNQGRIKTLTTELILQFGYEKVEKIFQNLLTNPQLCDIILS